MTELNDSLTDAPIECLPEDDPKIQTPLLWRDDGWTARVIKNENDDGWAVEMIKDGESEPALVKTAAEVLRRHEQQLHAQLHKRVTVDINAATFGVTLDIVPDDDNPYALLTAYDGDGAQLAQVQVAPTFKLSRESAGAWVENDFRRPR